MLASGGAGDVPTSTVEPEVSCSSELSEEQRSWESEWRARGDTNTVSGATTPSFARRESGMAILLEALEGASAGL